MAKTPLLLRYFQWFRGAIPFFLLWLVWEFLARSGVVKPFFLPLPSVIFSAMVESAREHQLWTDLGASTYRVLVGYLLAVIVGVPAGIWMGSTRKSRQMLEPFINFVRYTPLSAFVPLVILWIGLGDGNAITLVFLGVVWTLIVLTADAISSVPQHFVEVARTLGLRSNQVLWRVSCQHAAPAIYDALRLGLGLAWSSVVLAEIAGANVGLGHLLMNAQRFLKTPLVLGSVLLVGFLGLVSDAVFLWFYPRLFPWSERARRTHATSDR